MRLAATARTVVGTLALAAAVPAAVASSAPAAAAPAPACKVPRGAGPDYNASIGNKQNGGTFCLTVGEKLLVFLSAPSPRGPDWRRLRATPAGVLGPAPLTLMLARGVTATNFRAVRAGTAQVVSERRACPAAPPGGVTCDAIALWRATVVVRGATRAG
jgi:hypothetical protein